MLLQCQVDKRVERILAAFLRDFCDRPIWRLDPVVEKDPVVVGGSRFGSDGTIWLALLFGRRFFQFAPHLRISQRCFLFRERQVADIAPYRQFVEWSVTLESKNHAAPLAARLDKHAPA